MTLPLLFALLLSFSLGHAALALFWRPVARPALDFLLRSLFALGLGPALSSLLFLGWVSCIGSHKGWVFVELLLVAVLGTLAWRRERRMAATEADWLLRWSRPTLLQAVLGLIFFAALAAGMHTAWHYALQYPHGLWDAWAIWNQKARFIYRAPEQWRDVLTIHYSHPDYPLHLPSLVARTWVLVRQDAPIVPLLVGQFYLLALTAMLTAGVAIICGAAQGFIAGALLLGAQTFLYMSAAQYSDLPFAYHMLAACVALGLHDRFGRLRPQFLSLAGVFAALAAWTKNEGLVLALSLLIAWLFIAWWQHGRVALRENALRLGPLIAGAFVLVILHKATVPVQNQLLAGAVSEAGASKLFDGERHRFVATTAWEMLPRIFFWLRGKYAWTFPPGLVLLGYAVFAGLHREVRAARWALLLIFLGQALAYHLAFVTTPYNLSWHVNTALERLTQQLWPLFLYTYFLWVRPPEVRAPSALGV